MKICVSCQIEQSFNSFNRNRSTPDGLDCYCRPCRREIRKRHNNKGNTRVRNKRNRDKLVALNRELKSNPCTDCGGTFHFSAMEWDHLPGHDRINDVGKLANRAATLLFMEEIKKCELVCANCHAVRTWNRRLNAHGQSISEKGPQ